VAKVDDPQLKAMFETSAEVLLGLVKALGDYERKKRSRMAVRRPGLLRSNRAVAGEGMEAHPV